VAHDVRTLIAPLKDDDHVVVVGAGLAGWRFVQALRRDGFSGSISLIGDEAHHPYDRPPLSKQVLKGAWEKDKTLLAHASDLDDANVDALFGVSATALDVATTTVSLSDGRVIRGSHVVVASGTRARRLPFSADKEMLALRNLDDVENLLQAVENLAPHTTVVVIGGGFIGAEVATALKTRELSPIVLEVAERPLLNVLGPQVSEWLIGLASDAGIELRCSQNISDVTFEDGLFRVHVGDDVLATPVVVVGAGAMPNTEWLGSSGLDITNGVAVDEFLMATSHVGAIGDVARFKWLHGPFEEMVRIEHWQVANDHAQELAKILIQGSDVAGPVKLVPYFWSDQYGKKIQMLGHPSPSDEVTRVTGSPEEGKWLALFHRSGVITGAVSLNQPRGLILARPLVSEHANIGEALELKPWLA
jgi:3-phenylpropionate/trans-cinnamate dioxygenase ferredoxin reductase subunit